MGDDGAGRAQRIAKQREEDLAKQAQGLEEQVALWKVGLGSVYFPRTWFGTLPG
jgi:hypothetical protein